MFQDEQEHKGLGTTQKMSANPPYCVLKNVKMSQKKMRCFKGLLLSALGIYRTSKCPVSRSKCPVFKRLLRIDSKSFSSYLPINLSFCYQVTQEPPVTKTIQERAQDLPGTAAFLLCQQHKR